MSQRVSAEMNFANKSALKCKNIQVVINSVMRGGGLRWQVPESNTDNISPALESINRFSLDQNHLSY